MTAMKLDVVEIRLRTRCNKSRAELIRGGLAQLGKSGPLRRDGRRWVFEWWYPRKNVTWPFWVFLLIPDIVEVKEIHR